VQTSGEEYDMDGINGRSRRATGRLLGIGLLALAVLVGIHVYAQREVGVALDATSESVQLAGFALISPQLEPSRHATYEVVLEVENPASRPMDIQVHDVAVTLDNIEYSVAAESALLTVEAGGPMTFSAGQYAQVEFAPGLSRHYSMANTPDEPELVFHIRHMPGGRTSSHVARQLKVGDKVKVSGPLGVSYLRESHAGPVLLIAGGSGLAPIQSILCTLLARGYAAPVRLYFGVRSERDLYHERLLKDLAAQHANFEYRVVLSEQIGASGRRYGLVHEAIDLPIPQGAMAYLAGPPVMVEAASARLRSQGLTPRQIHADAFYDQN
jgi:naphthalene 1,2-dioxygenase ferredoxin reductase component